VTVLFVLPAATIYDRQGRVTGWRATPSSREAMRELKALVPRLKELGPVKVVGSDFDHESVWLLGRKLGVPYAEWVALRRLNVGKLHGTETSKFEKLYQNIQAKWKDKPDVAICNSGDSWTSYTRRIANAKGLLASLEGTVVCVAGAREIGQLIGKDNLKLEHGRVHECQINA
jgi:broad specificity phosphatase PhoE